MTISSNEAFPALSPMPLMVHSNCLAPAVAPAKLLAVASPRSFWQWVEITTFSPPGVSDLTLLIRAAYSCGNAQPVVSGMFRVVAPALVTSDRTLNMKSRSDRLASSGLNSMSWHPWDLRYLTALTACSTTWSGVILSLYCMWMGEVAMKTCTLGLFACLTAFHAASRSLVLVLQEVQFIESDLSENRHHTLLPGGQTVNSRGEVGRQ